MKNNKTNDTGFTLIELMIALAVFSVIISAVYMIYREQLRTHYTQQEVMEMQQNIRAALYLMEKEIKMAGLNPTGAAGIGITTADAHRLDFSADFTGGAGNGIDDDGDFLTDEGSDGLNNNNDPNGWIDEADEAEWYDGKTNDPNEQVSYILSNDADNNGINNGLPTENNNNGTCDLMRNGEILALNIDAINFVYLDGNGNPIATPVADTSDIRSIQVSLVARSSMYPSALTRNYVDTRQYQNQQGTLIMPAQKDTFRRIMMSIEVKCRNMGLQ